MIDDQPVPVMLVVTRQGERLTDGQIGRHRRIADRMGVEVRHLTVGTANHPTDRGSNDESATRA